MAQVNVDKSNFFYLLESNYMDKIYQLVYHNKHIKPAKH